jgi:outer membrane usher protein
MRLSSPLNWTERRCLIGFLPFCLLLVLAWPLAAQQADGMAHSAFDITSAVQESPESQSEATTTPVADIPVAGQDDEASVEASEDLAWPLLPLPVFEQYLAAVIVRSQNLADILIEASADDFRIDAQLLSAALDGVLRDELRRSLTALDRPADAADLRAMGIEPIWNAALSSLTLDIPFALSPIRLMDTPLAASRLSGPVLTQQFFSAILNYTLRTGIGGSVPSWDYPTSLNGELYLNLAGWVLETGLATEFDKDLASVRLTRARLVKDFVPVDMRLTLGRIDVPTVAFQAAPPLLGVLLQRRNFFDTRRLVDPRFETLVLEQAATVRVLLNGNPIRTLRLAPGAWRLADLPLASGINTLAVIVEEQGRDPYSMNLSRAYETSLLAPGMLDFAVVAAIEEGDQARPFASGFVRLGLTDWLDGTLSMQGGFGRLLATASLGAASRLGNLFVDSALSMALPSDAFQPSGAVALRYRLAFPGQALPGLGLALHYETAGFAIPRTQSVSVPDVAVLRASAALSSPLPGGFSGTLMGDIRSSPAAGTLSGGLSLMLQRRLGQGTGFSALASLNRQGDGRLIPSLNVTVNSIASGPQRIFSATHDVVRRSTGFNYLGGTTLGAFDLETSLRGSNLLGHADDTQSLGASARLRLTNLDLGLSATLDRDPSVLGLMGSTANLLVSMSGALVLAGGSFGLSRQINDAFVLLAPERGLDNVTTSLRTGAGGSALLARGGQTAVGRLASYRQVQAQIDLPDAPLDMVPDQTFVVLSAGYRSGVLVQPTIKPNLTVVGRLVDSAGRPLAWTLGTISDASGVSLGRGFTDQDGHFEFFGLGPGKHRVAWQLQPQLFSRFALPYDASSFTELGDILASLSDSEEVP